MVIITGTPSTGKTTLAREIKKRYGFPVFDLEEFIKKNKLCVGYDRKRRCAIVDEEKTAAFLGKEIRDRIRKGEKTLIESHFSHYLPANLVDLCLVTRCDLQKLYQRLKKKKYPKNKIEENMECEIMEVCLQEAHERKHRLLIVDMSKREKEKRKK